MSRFELCKKGIFSFIEILKLRVQLTQWKSLFSFFLMTNNSRNKVLVYSRFLTNRLDYVLKHVFKTLMELDFVATTDKEFFQKEDGIKINYSDEEIESSFQIVPVNLLFEKEIKSQDIVLNTWEDLPCFFSTAGDIPFDIFAAIFFLISRYEEYFSEEIDNHQRFDFSQSVAYQYGFLQLPLVDLWTKKLREKIVGSQQVDEIKRSFQFVPTVDVDHFYKYKDRGVVKSFALLLRDFLFDFKQFKQRVFVLLGFKNDPWLNFDRVDKFHQKHNQMISYFFHVGGRGLFDKRCKNSNAACYRKAIAEQSKRSSVGLHISYEAAFDVEKIRSEKKRLQKWSGKEISKNRFHFLRFSLPNSYRILQEEGILEDYSMAYAQQIGFRASTCVPFYFYDLESDRETLLKVVPTIFMDTTLETHLQLSLEDAYSLITELIDKVRHVQGKCVFILHNELFSTEKDKRLGECFYDSIFNYVTNFANHISKK